MILRALAVLVLFLSCAVAAQPTPSTYLAAEKEIARHEDRLTQVAEGLESWLAGRTDQAAFQQLIENAQAGPATYRRLDPKTAQAVGLYEKELLRRIHAFANVKAPDSDGQRALFLRLGELTESRTRALMSWRQKELRQLLASDLTSEQHAYYRWQFSWTEIWDREADLTSELEHAFLGEDDSTSPQELLRALLKLRLRADSTACPKTLLGLDALSKERLTVLTRTAEQLLRLKERRSSGALTRVRRLSRQLSELTQKFRNQRIVRLESLI